MRLELSLVYLTKIRLYFENMNLPIAGLIDARGVAFDQAKHSPGIDPHSCPFVCFIDTILKIQCAQNREAYTPLLRPAIEAERV